MLMTPGFSSRGAQLQLGLVTGDGVDAVGPAEERENYVVGRAVEYADGADQRGHHGVAHEAAVGEHGGKQQQIPAMPVRVVDHQTGQYNESHMQQEGHSHHDIKVVERILLNGTLEGHQQHTGADDIHHQRAHAGGAMVIDELELPQHVAHGHQQI